MVNAAVAYKDTAAAQAGRLCTCHGGLGWEVQMLPANIYVCNYDKSVRDTDSAVSSKKRKQNTEQAHFVANYWLAVLIHSWWSGPKPVTATADKPWRYPANFCFSPNGIFNVENIVRCYACRKSTSNIDIRGSVFKIANIVHRGPSRGAAEGNAVAASGINFL